jgi:protein-arginine kinase activator protein McsA
MNDKKKNFNILHQKCLSRESLIEIIRLQEESTIPKSTTWDTRKKNLSASGKSFDDLYPVLSCQWSGKNHLSPKECSKSSRVYIVWDCTSCGTEFASTTGNRLLGKGCHNCAQLKRRESFQQTKSSRGQSLANRSPFLTHEWHPTLNGKLTPQTVSYGTSKYGWWLCSNCNYVWKSSIKNRLSQNTPCPACRPKSLLEGIVGNYLAQIHNGRIIHNSMPLRYQGRRLQLDFYLPDLRLAVEVQDFATHSLSKENEPCQLGPKLKGLRKKGPAYHKRKHQLALEQLDTFLVDLWEDSIRDNSFKPLLQEVVRNRVKTLRVE